ncbi:uncharacterized protein K460DRAFT_358665 [Cucurbitaria berberidis CBS 394.84]|uniref:BTB domain-containing protein n=1 Tax=Cucurbitaria berberidis CBS 394.84 TaxID=1168544 RepID=A0A9P4L555_9PLEO|nr:uncharacterized protein K460DRAFT_358665 [Cucurbitaria berberidis CBS 394.84]KAF1841984.1 hypothetical protein K460DRAFT_358665 [Cucurbitaria berberidis CBS 394.84]
MTETVKELEERQAKHQASLLPLTFYGSHRGHKKSNFDMEHSESTSQPSLRIPPRGLQRTLGLENKICLPECDPQYFQIFVQWIYFGNLPTFLEFTEHVRFSRGFPLWVMGDMLMAQSFKGHAMEKIYRRVRCAWLCKIMANEVEYCWNHTTPGSLLRKFTVDLVAQDVMHNTFIGKSKEWQQLLQTHSDLQCEVLSTIAKSTPNRSGEPEYKPVSEYLEDPKAEE